MFADAYSDCQANLPVGVEWFRDPCGDIPIGAVNTAPMPNPVPVNPQHIEADTNIVPMLVAAAGAFLMLKG